MDVKTLSVGQAESPGARAGSSGHPRDQGWGGFGWFLVKLLVAVLLFRTLVFSPFSIPSESMLPRLANGDYLLAAKWPYGYSRFSLPFDAPLFSGRVLAGPPQRGDIVIFKHPVDQRDYIKRVIALPGDSIAMAGGQLLLNGRRIAREARPDFVIPLSANTGCEWGGEFERTAAGVEVCRYRRFRETLPGGRSYDVLDFGLTPSDSFAPVTVPAGAMFVMGDNRDNSRDSRFPAMAGDAVGLVPQENLVGRAGIIMWSTDGNADWLRPWTWFTSARWDRIGTLL